MFKKIAVIDHSFRLKYGLSGSEMLFLDTLASSQVDVQDIAKFLGINSDRVNTIIVKLVGKGLIDITDEGTFVTDLYVQETSIGYTRNTIKQKWPDYPTPENEYEKFINWIKSRDGFTNIKHMRPPSEDQFLRMKKLTLYNASFVRNKIDAMIAYHEISKRKDFYLTFIDWSDLKGLKELEIPTEKEAVEFFASHKKDPEQGRNFYRTMTINKWVKKIGNREVMIRDWKREAAAWLNMA